MIVKCKSWNGPFSSVEEFELALAAANENKSKEILRHEITLQNILPPNDTINRN